MPHSFSGLPAYYETLMNVLGTQRLSDTLLAVANEASGVDELFGFLSEGEGSPVPIASSGRIGSSQCRAELYTSRFHAQDPLAGVIASVPAGAPTRCNRVAASDIADPIYRRECFERPGLAEKLTFVRASKGRHVVLSFYRHRGSRAPDLGALTQLADTAIPMLSRHADLLGAELTLPLLARIERRMAGGYPALTRREREVCARTLIGMTSEAIALDLGIGATSVLTYRRRAYERYRISGTADMIGGVLM